MKRIAVVFLVATIQLAAQTSSSAASSNPKVRAITAFLRLNRETYSQQISDALAVLRKAKAEFHSAGYEVETLRVTTQPLEQLVAGETEEQALAFLTQLDQVSTKENFLLNVGPGMMDDGDASATMQLLERALSTLHISGSTIIADDTGIHWKTIHCTAELMKYVSEHSPHSQGTFNFAATAMLQPCRRSSRALTTPVPVGNSPAVSKEPMWCALSS